MTTMKFSYPNASNVLRTTLDNGLTLLVYENPHVNSVVFTGTMHSGSLYESPERGGLASLTAGSLMRGTENRDFDTIHSALEDIGADLGISSGMHRIGYSGKALAEDLPLLMDILSDCLRRPIFPEDQVERLRGERLTWLAYRQQDTRWVSAKAFREALYPDTHPYHYGVRGTMQTLPTIQVEELCEFHRNHYGPQGMTLVIVGAVNADETVETVKRYFADWHNPNQSTVDELPPLDAPSKSSRVVHAIPGKTQSDVVIGTVGPARKESDYQAANIANSILGQFGMMGRVGDVVREREGMAYYAYSRLEGGSGPGAWNISAGVNPANVDKAIELSIGELRRLIEEPVTEEEFEDNLSYYTGRLPLQLETSEGLAGVLHSMELYDLGLDYLEKYQETLYSLTREQLLEAARKYINPDALVVAVAGPESAG